MKELMIHQWNDKYLDLPLDNYILSFDDGLSGQVKGILDIIKKYPDIKIRYYVSTDIINVEQTPRTFNDCRTAHELYFSSNIKSDYITYDELNTLSKLPNVTIGLHGHKHLNLDHLKKNKCLKDYFQLMENDIKEMLFSAINLLQFNILKNNTIHFCTPYNQLHSLYIASMRKQFSMYFPDVEFVITGPGREDIDNISI